MARFTNFNNILSVGNKTEDDDSDEEDENTQDEDSKKNGGFDEDDDDNDDDSGQKIKKVDAKAPSELVNDFTDNNYWDIGKGNEEVDVDSLLAELDS